MIPASGQGRLCIASDDGRLTVAVPWDGAEECQSYLRRSGLRSILVLDPVPRDAHLEMHPGTDPVQVQKVLDLWGR